MSNVETILKEALVEALNSAYQIVIDIKDVNIEVCKDKLNGDYASNLAMQYAKSLRMAPQKIAEKIIEHIDYQKYGIKGVKIGGPGFLNIKMEGEILASIISEVLAENTKFGNNTSGNNIKINVEYVSANPTGDLHLGHARGAAWGDSVTRLLKASGYDVCREFYVNDAGNQIHNLTLSLMARYNQAFDIKMDLPEDGYYGEDVKAIIEIIKKDINDLYVEDQSEKAYAYFKTQGLKYELAKLKKDLNDFRVDFDVWSSEQAIHDAHLVEKVMEELKAKNYSYEKDGAIWFKSSEFGDDKDRVLKKRDGSYTYLVPDMAYHIEKFKRGFIKLVNFWGADHHGYIPRMKAALTALGQDADGLEVDIIQMVRLVEDGVEVKMSKRSGNAISLRELCEDIGVDAVRYFFVQRALDTHLDFDLSLARSASNDNPVYYAQYAHARICSILKSANFEQCNTYELLSDEKEVALLKMIHSFKSLVKDAAGMRSPNKICNYIHKLAASFHSFYGSCKVIDDTNPALSAQRVDLLKATRITLSNALALIGVNAPEKM